MIPLLLNATLNNDLRNAITASQNNSQEKLYTTKEVADILGVTEYTVRKKIREGELLAKKFLGHAGYRIRHDDLLDYLNIHCTHNPEKLSQNHFFNPIPEFFSATIQNLADALNSDAQNNHAAIQTFIDGKKIDLDSLTLRLRLLELDKDSTSDFLRKKFSLELAINQLQAEIKAYELFKLALDKNPSEATQLPY